MIEVRVQCDKCGRTAQIMGGLQRYNNNIIGFPLPDEWYSLIDKVICDTCLEQIVQKDVNNEQQ